MKQETQHTIAIFPGKAKRPKIFSKRDIASTSVEQKNVLKKVGRRATINETSSSSEPEQPAPKKGKTQKQEKAKTPEVAIEFDEEMPPSVIDISSNTTENENPTQEPTKEISCKTESGAPKETNKPEKVAIPVKATTSLTGEYRRESTLPPKDMGLA